MPRNTVIRLTLALVLLFTLPSYAISTEEEIQLGAQAAQQFEAQHGVVTDTALNERINRIGHRLLQNAERKNLPWRFRIINVDQFNAAAFPGGFIYATRGLMNGLNDEELAFVIGHEIGHVDKRHSIKQLESAQLRRLGLIAIAAGATRGNVNDGVGTLVQLTDAVIGSQRSQGDESESDRYGMQLMAAGNYDPAFALGALRKLSQASGGGTPGFLNTLLGSHPLPQDRLNQGAALVTSVPFNPTPLPPVNSRADTTRPFFESATSALGLTLHLMGHDESPQLNSEARRLAANPALSSPYQVIRVSGPAENGLIGLESQLLRKTELSQPGRDFGAAVVENVQGEVEAYVVLRKGQKS